jgi:hypothetical protein
LAPRMKLLSGTPRRHWYCTSSHIYAKGLYLEGANIVCNCCNKIFLNIYGIP